MLQNMEEKLFDGYSRFSFYQTSFIYKINSKLNGINRSSSFEDKWLNR